MKVAIIGAGLIGNKRAQALDENDSLIIVCDKNDKKAQKIHYLEAIPFNDKPLSPRLKKDTSL